MRPTDCGSCKEKSIWVHPAAAGPFYWHIRWDTGGEIGLICFSCHLNGRSLSRGKALTGLRSQWANSQSSFIGFLSQTLCLMRAAACNRLPELKKERKKKSSGWLSSHVDLSLKGRCCFSFDAGNGFIEATVFKIYFQNELKKNVCLGFYKHLRSCNRRDGFIYCYSHRPVIAVHFPSAPRR